MNHLYWEVEDFYYLYTEDVKTKLNIEPMAIYFSPKNNKPFAFQYKLEKDSKKQVDVFVALGVKSSDKFVEKRQRKKKGE